MIDATQIPYALLDLVWKPKWKKEALANLKGGQKFLHFKRDLLENDRVEEITSRIQDLKKTMRARDQDAVSEACKQLQGTCEHSLKSYRPPDALSDNLEVFFVAIAVALGIRAYYVQPFRIPTGSMQPTLNGIVGHPQPLDKAWQKPNPLVRGFHKITEGRSYVQIKSPVDGYVVGLSENPKHLWFFQRTYLHFDNGKKVGVGGSLRSIVDGLKLGESLGFVSQVNDIGERHYQMPKEGRLRVKVKKNQVLAQGWVDTGDLVLVDKMSYHFRKPTRGEVFVFETRGIERIVSEARLNNQNRGSHYIKRLVGVPGDRLGLEEPSLIINGKLPLEKGIKEVMSLKNGYHGYFNIPGLILGSGARITPYRTALNTPQSSIQLAKGLHKDQYFAMGDNSANSSDSRYWGAIDEYLLVGPGLFTLWPFENFGPIR